MSELNEVIQNVTRLEVVNHTKCDNCSGSGIIHIEGQKHIFECPACNGRGMIGREVILHNPSKKITADLQDDGRTLKIFIEERV